MILENLELNNFGKFSQASFTFKPVLNLVLGPNEAGKSTLMEAIPTLFFGVRNKERFQNWKSSGNCRVSAVFRHGQKVLRIERDILSDQVSLVEEEANAENILYCFEGKVSSLGRSSEKAEYSDRIARELGIVEEDIFRSSLFYGQGSLELSNRNDLGVKVKNLLSGSVEVDYEKVLKSIQDDYFAITRTSPWGRDKTNDRELEKVKLRLEQLEKSWLENRDASRKMEELHKRIEALNQELEKDRKDFSQGKRYLKLLKDRFSLEEKEKNLQEEFRRLQKEEQKIESLQREKKLILEAIRDMAIPEEVSEDLPRLVYELQELRQRAAAVEKDINEVYRKLPPPGKIPWLLLFLVCLCMVGGAAFLVQKNPEWLVPMGLGAGLGISLLFLFLLKKNSLRSNERSLIKGQADILEAGLEETRKSLLSLEEYLDKLGLKHSDEELLYLRSALQRRAGYKDRIRGVESALEVLDKPGDLEELKAGVIRELAVLDEKKLNSHADSFLADMVDLPEAEEKLSALEEQLKKKEKELSELEQEESFLAGQLGNLPSIEEEGDYLKEKGLFLTERKKVLRLAYDLLSEAVEDFRQRYLERFSSDVGQTLGALLENQDRNIKVTDEFNFCIKENSKDWKPLNHFSQGTVDAAFFAVRLVLTKQLFQGRQLPLFLDDPLVNFDSKRLVNTLQYLENLTAEHQVILFSHDSSLLDLINSEKWNVISIPG